MSNLTTAFVQLGSEIGTAAVREKTMAFTMAVRYDIGILRHNLTALTPFSTVSSPRGLSHFAFLIFWIVSKPTSAGCLVAWLS